MKQTADVIILGAGPGGYPAAIRAAQLGKKVVIIDKGTIGGECLNWGCIPSKALISAANFYHKATVDAVKMGINIENVSVDVQKLQKWKWDVQTKLINGIKQLLKGNKVTTVIGTASFLDSHTVEILTNNGEKNVIAGQHIIIAIGTEFISLPGFQIDEESILSAKGALNLTKIPEEMLIIGGGVIGMELGMVYAKFGAKITVVELLPDILPGIEPRITALIKRRFKDLKADIFTNSKATSVTKRKSGKLEVKIETKDQTILKTFDKILLSVGKRSNTSSLNLKVTGVKTDEKGFIKVNKRLQTNIPNIYAIGDCTGMPFTAHKATKQGIVAAEVAAGLESEADFKALNVGAIFTDPEISFVGMNETEAKEAGYQVRNGIARFGTSGRALTHLSTDGFVKVVSNAENGVILGVQIVGPDASDLISEASLALEMGATVEDIGWTVHPHPTLPEMVMEAADTVLGKAIHQVNLTPRNR
ncbi:MAG: dihydrolipoyl dehydrogenase [Candidatus Heimdallarchaeota archaeon]